MVAGRSNRRPLVLHAYTHPPEQVPVVPVSPRFEDEAAGLKAFLLLPASAFFPGPHSACLLKLPSLGIPGLLEATPATVTRAEVQ